LSIYSLKKQLGLLLKKTTGQKRSGLPWNLCYVYWNKF